VSNSSSNSYSNNNLSLLQLEFSQDELETYTASRKVGLNKASIPWISKAAEIFWNSTRGVINKSSLDVLRTFVVTKYQCEYAKGKALNFAKAFLKYLTKVHLDTRYQTFEIFLQKPKALKERKNVTTRIITREDIVNIIAHISKAEQEGLISRYKALQFTAFVLFGAYTGQRTLATMMKLTVGQFRDALQLNKPVLYVKSSQDKIKMSHVVPLHPELLKSILLLLDGRDNDKHMFEYYSICKWITREKIPLSRISGHFVLGDLRKFAEQYGDIIQWEQSNRAYILTHGVSGVEWAHYRHPLPEYVYDVYMKYWKDVCFVR
jgi:integrase